MWHRCHPLPIYFTSQLCTLLKNPYTLGTAFSTRVFTAPCALITYAEIIGTSSCTFLFTIEYNSLISPKSLVNCVFAKASSIASSRYPVQLPSPLKSHAISMYGSTGGYVYSTAYTSYSPVVETVISVAKSTV